MIDRWQVQNDIRQAGSIQRYHAWPTIQRQSVAEHTWQMLRIYFQVWGPLPPEVTTHMIFHDAGELHIGDVPFGAKDKSKVLRSELDRLEQEAITILVGEIKELPPNLKRRVKICDLIEMWEFGHTEELLGNKLAHPITADTIRALDRILGNAEAPDEVDLVNKYMKKRKGIFQC